jgi:hypothetical protein
VASINTKRGADNTKERIKRKVSFCERIMKKQNDKVNNIKTGNEQKDK